MADEGPAVLLPASDGPPNAVISVPHHELRECKHCPRYVFKVAGQWVHLGGGRDCRIAHELDAEEVTTQEQVSRMTWRGRRTKTETRIKGYRHTCARCGKSVLVTAEKMYSPEDLRSRTDCGRKRATPRVAF